MGRPIKKTFFGNLITPYQNHAVGGLTGVGGEGVASVTISNSGTTYSQATTISFGAPNISGGIQATGYPVIPATGPNAGKVTSITVTEAGTGYTSAPTLTLTTGTQVTQGVTNFGLTATNTMSVASVVGIAIGMRIYGGGNGGLVTAVNTTRNWVTSSLPNDVTFTNASNLRFFDEGSGFADTVVLTDVNPATARPNAIAFTAFLPTGSNAVANGDILKQESSRRYLVRTTEGTGQCRLVGKDVLVAGEMKIIATDFGGATYYVTKLTAHKAYLVNRTSTSTALVSIPSGGTGVGGWTLGSSTGTIVTIANV